MSDGPVRIAVDALGGDRAPEEIVAGALEAPETDPRIVPILFGPRGLRLRLDPDTDGGAYLLGLRVSR